MTDRQSSKSPSPHGWVVGGLLGGALLLVVALSILEYTGRKVSQAQSTFLAQLTPGNVASLTLDGSCRVPSRDRSAIIVALTTARHFSHTRGDAYTSLGVFRITIQDGTTERLEVRDYPRYGIVVAFFTSLIKQYNARDQPLGGAVMGATVVNESLRPLVYHVLATCH